MKFSAEMEIMSLFSNMPYDQGVLSAEILVLLRCVSLVPFLPGRWLDLYT